MLKRPFLAVFADKYPIVGSSLRAQQDVVIIVNNNFNVKLNNVLLVLGSFVEDVEITHDIFLCLSSKQFVYTYAWCIRKIV